jgi:Fructose-bisphosphate aldolase class-II
MQRLLSSFKYRKVELLILLVPSLIAFTKSIQARVSPIAINLQVLLAPLLERTISALWLLSTECPSYCTPITVPRNCSPGLMECWTRTRNISRNTESHSLGIRLTTTIYRSSHMVDLSEEPKEENIELTKKYFKRAVPMKQWPEMEIGITGGEEDGFIISGLYLQ